MPQHKERILADPIYGTINFPSALVYQIIDHPYFQRLRRIYQLGLSHYVYSGATHNRFSHSIGACHLMVLSISHLRSRGINITDDEYEATCAAILLHDIGHVPFSHALEHKILSDDHETLSLCVMRQLNDQLSGALDLCISIFCDQYHKRFLHQLISSQLDVDRLDYLIRDSFYTGVSEAAVGYQRLIKTMNVIENQLCFESKGFYSVEKFIMSRYLMYKQVYLHKAALSAENMLILFISNLKDEIQNGNFPIGNIALLEFLKLKSPTTIQILDMLHQLDDNDIYTCLKICSKSEHKILKFLSVSILDRKLFKIIIQNSSIDSTCIEEIKSNVALKQNVSLVESSKLIITNNLPIKYYDTQSEIKILENNGTISDFSHHSLLNFDKINSVYYYVCYPKC